MDTTMDQLRSFIHQRLCTAADEILGEVQKTIKLALYEVEATRSKEEVESLRHQLDVLRKKSAAEASLTSSTVEHGDKSDAPLLQENQRTSTPEEANFSVSAEVPGLSQTSADPDINNWSYCLVQTDVRMSEIKEEQEEPWDDSLVARMFAVSPPIERSRDDQPKTRVSFEMRPVSDTSAAQSELDGSDKEWVEDNEKQDRIKKKSFCKFCGKGFQYIGSLNKHIKTHGTNFDCNVCEVKCKSPKELATHVKDCHSESHCCDLCGKAFANLKSLRVHGRIHCGRKVFECQHPQCDKAFYRKDHLKVHMRTHSGEKPYRCDICGNTFTQSQSLTLHVKRRHLEKKQ